MPSSQWTVTVYLDSFLNLYHCSNILAGLGALSEAGRVTWTAEAPGDGRTSYTNSSLILRMDVTDAKGSTRRLALDLYDRSDRFSEEQLGVCDRYYKRSYYSPDIQQLPSEWQNKVRPLGLNYAGRTGVGRPLGTLARDYALRLTRAGLGGPGKLKRELQQLQVRGFLQSPLVSQFEQAPPLSSVSSGEAPVQILFQTRLWAADEVGPGESWEEINGGRVGVLQALKRAFPKHFVGGVMPTPFAKQHYPELISAGATGRRSFIAWSRSCPIGVYTRGLHHSQAFKLAEYLASSKCIVSDPMRNQWPGFLTEGTHYLEFSRPEECAAQCEALLRDPSQAQAMRAANWSYYQSQVRPDARMLRLLSDVFDGQKEAPGLSGRDLSDPLSVSPQRSR